MKIGFGSSKITPSGKIVIAGAIPVRYTDKVHDDIFASAMVINANEKLTVLLSCDICHPNRRLTDEAVLALKSVIPNFSSDQLIFCATHATAGFYLTDDEFLNAGLQIDFDKIMPLDETRKQICEGIVSAVKAALDTMCECTMEFATADILTGFCRRVLYKNGKAVMYGNPHTDDFVRMEYPDGPSSQMLYFYTKENHTLKGVFAAVPCPAQCDESSVYITADYWASVRKEIKSAFGDEVVLMPFCRAAGELSPHRIAYTAGNYSGDEWGEQAAVLLGKRIAESIIRESFRPLKKYSADELSFAIKHKSLDFPVRMATDEELREALEYFKNLQNFYENGMAKDWISHMKYAHIRKLQSENKEFYKARVSALKIADVLIFTAPAELYCEYSKKVCMRFQKNPIFDIQLADDSLGYLPTKEAIEHGGYSTDIFSCLTTTDGGEMYVEETKKLLREIID